VHGGTGTRNRWRKTVGKGVRQDVKYFASLVFSDDLNGVLAECPKKVTEIEGISWLGARGRAYHDLINKNRPISE
jgi:hypothetical protein